MAYMQNGPSWLSPGNEKSQIYILTEIYSTVILDHAWRLAGKMNFTAAISDVEMANSVLPIESNSPFLDDDNPQYVG